MPFFPSLPANATTREVFDAHPDVYANFMYVSQGIMRGDSPLSAGERELIGAYVSALNSCGYCYGGHRAAAEAFGVAPEIIDGLVANVATAPVDPKLRPLFAYVQKLTLRPSRLTQADADAVFAAGWDEAALHSAVAVCAMFNFMNRLVEGHGIAADPAMFAERGRKHAELGYLKQFVKQ